MDFMLRDLRKFLKRVDSKDQQTRDRILTLIELKKRLTRPGQKPQEQDFKRAARVYGKSPRSLRRWWNAWVLYGIPGLHSQARSGRPKKSYIRGRTAQLIKNYRRRYSWGAEVIHEHLKRDHGIDLGEYRIYRFLVTHRLVEKAKRKRAEKKHSKVVKVETPGAHTQTDVKHLPHLLPEKKKCYVYNFVDHASRWSYKRVYESYGPMETRDFFERLLQLVPFTILRSQQDNGVEFTNRFRTNEDAPKEHAFEKLCREQGIRHVLIPPGEKELQGLVERSHRQDDEELYHRIRPVSLEHFNRLLESHCEWRNQSRRRKALDWRTSNEYLTDFKRQVQAWLFKNEPSPFVPRIEILDQEVQTENQNAHAAA